MEITLRADGGDGGGAAAVNAPPTGDAPDEGAVLMGTVRRVQTYGVFVTLDDCGGRSGLCHISAFADARIDDGLDAHVRAGRTRSSERRVLSHWSPYDRVGVVNADP